MNRKLYDKLHRAFMERLPISFTWTHRDWDNTKSRVFQKTGRVKVLVKNLTLFLEGSTVAATVGVYADSIENGRRYTIDIEDLPIEEVRNLKVHRGD